MRELRGIFLNVSIVVDAMLGTSEIRTDTSFGASSSSQQYWGLGMLLESSGFLKNFPQPMETVI